MDGRSDWCTTAAAASAAAAVAASCGPGDRGAAGVLYTSLSSSLLPAWPALLCRPIMLAIRKRRCQPACLATGACTENVGASLPWLQRNFQKQDIAGGLAVLIHYSASGPVYLLAATLPSHMLY